MKPPCTERYARWCERTGVNHSLLLDWIFPGNALSGAAAAPDGAYLLQRVFLNLNALPERPRGHGAEPQEVAGQGLGAVVAHVDGDLGDTLVGALEQFRSPVDTHEV